MSDFRFLGEVPASLAPHPLLPEGYVFSNDAEVVITQWGDILPPVSFSSEQFYKVMSIAVRPRLVDGEGVILLAGYLRPKLRLAEGQGCWELPLKAEYDDKKRARYPLISINQLGYDKQLAHRASVETFRGIPLPRRESRHLHVDHRCRNHACCNPYHLDVVSAGENNRRKIVASRRQHAPDLFQLPTGNVALGQVQGAAGY
jgi:hypothetical protein